METNITQNMENNKSFCILPFIHLATHPIGTVTPCCITDMVNDMSTSKKDGSNLFLGKDTLDDISNSDNFKEIRRKLLNNEFPLECKTCHFYDKNGIGSKRIESNNKFQHLIEGAIKNTNEDGSIIKLNYKYIELRLGTTCNLKCTTCNPFSSSRWNQDVDVFKGTTFEKGYFKCDIKTDWYKNYSFYDDLLEHSEEIEEVWINGGEPTLIKEHSYFLQKLIERGIASNISLHYSLNLTDISDDFINLWKPFKSVRLQLSIDDLYERNDYIRYGSKWDIIFGNFLKIYEHKNEFSLEICQTISALNVYTIDKFKEFFEKYNLIIAHNYVHYPEHLHVSVIPSDMKVEILKNIKNLRIDEYNRLEAELNRETTEIQIDDFYSFNKLLDIKRNLNISDYLSEWKEIFI